MSLSVTVFRERGALTHTPLCTPLFAGRIEDNTKNRDDIRDRYDDMVRKELICRVFATADAAPNSNEENIAPNRVAASHQVRSNADKAAAAVMPGIKTALLPIDI